MNVPHYIFINLQHYFLLHVAITVSYTHLMSGRSITPEEAIELCEKKETPVLTGFRDKNGQPMERKLSLIHISAMI